ncbi:LPP20 family lipoprotein [Vibrio palustris]|uniref:Lipoprotein LPP20-like domain-containing protein n=1 Tax=Vibrio palustris TaxID=1918946 RepID=A0A1R4B3M4_9VIBR|nr:LPP20 family lipoprotein [Vibrio palustris]SJL83501.1 hypothetical protein VPAL9027_01469 [Vibrio palustris]
MKMRLTLGLSALVLAGCQTTQTTADAQHYQQCKYPKAQSTEAPAWVCDVMPNDLGIAAKGYAQKSIAGLSMMRQIAINDARANIAQQFEARVQRMFEQATSGTQSVSTDNGQTETFKTTLQSATKTIVDRTLTNSRLIVSQVSPNGDLYVLVGMDKPTYQANLNQAIDGINQDTSLWKKFNDKKAESELKQSLNDLKNL